MTFRTRLPVDPHVVAYWGWDEANEADAALDEGSYNRPLTVFNAAAVMPARLGNGRQFDGATTYAAPADSVPFRLNDLTIITWVTLDSVNQAGSLKRVILACDGVSATPVVGGILFLLAVDNNGALVFEHTAVDGALIRWQTANGFIRTARYHAITLTRDVELAYATVNLWINNAPVAWASVTRNGVPLPDPTKYPAPVAPDSVLSTQTFKVGISDKYPDAWWQGVVDETSLHDIARPRQPYLIDAYFRLTMNTTFQRLTGLGRVRTLGSVEMGGGSRWWCYERDQDIYVVRENSLGLYGKEILLTTGGVNALTGATTPAGFTQPRLAYDPVSDILLVAFVLAGKVYKLTAASSDDPATQNVPGTADTISIVKLVDNSEPQTVGAMEAPVLDERFGDEGTAATVVFLDVPTFGLAVEGNNPYGYAVYRRAGGAVTFIGTTGPTKQTARWAAAGNYWHVPIAPRAYGAGYFALPVRSGGRVGAAMSNIVIDYLGVFGWTADADPSVIHYGTTRDTPHEADPLIGGYESAIDATLQGFGFVARTPVKYASPADEQIIGAGEARQLEDPWGFIARTPVKLASTPDPQTISAGETVGVTMRGSTGARLDP